MTLGETIGALAHFPDDAQITVTVRKSDLVRALERRGGGAATLTTAEASAAHGYPADRWRRWAEAGRIEGAWQDAAGAPWRLPSVACEAHVRALQSAARRRNTGVEPRPVATSRRRPPSPRPVRSATRGPHPSPSAATARTGGGPIGPRVRRSGSVVVLPLTGARASAEG